MKPIQLALAPTRSRPLNMFLGMLLALVSVLLFLALASYHTADPSWNTSVDPAVPTAVHNLVGPLGAYLSDLSLQWLGLATFLIPLWMSGVAWGWMRSRPGGSAWLRALGVTMSLVFVPVPVCAAAVALALCACGSGGRRGRAPGRKPAGGLPQYPGGVAGGGRAGRGRRLLRLGAEFLGTQGDAGGPLDSPAVVDGPVEKLAGGARRTACRPRGGAGGAEPARSAAAHLYGSHRERGSFRARGATKAQPPGSAVWASPERAGAGSGR